MAMLANSEILGWANLGVSAFISLALAYVGSKTRKIDCLEEKLEAKAGELVDTKVSLAIAEWRTETKTWQAQFATEMRQVLSRLERGDNHFGSLDTQRQKLELRTQEMLADLKQWVTANSASKADLKKLDERFTALQIAVARAEAARESLMCPPGERGEL